VCIRSLPAGGEVAVRTLIRRCSKSEGGSIRGILIAFAFDLSSAERLRLRCVVNLTILMDYRLL
jgi:hypothetical protein